MYSLDEFHSRFSASPALAQRLAGVFLSEGPRQLGLLQEAIATGNPQEVSKAAHRLRGAVSNYGYPNLVDLLADLEQDAESQSAEQWTTSCKKVSIMVDEMVEKLSSTLV